MQPIIILSAGRSGSKLARSFVGRFSDVYEIPFDIGYVWTRSLLMDTNEEYVSELNDDFNYSETRRHIDKIINSHKKPHHKFFVEKSVPNSLRPEIIRKVYPDAKIICLVRNPYAVFESTLRVWNTPPKYGYLFKKFLYAPNFDLKYLLKLISNIAVKLFVKSPSPSVNGSWGPKYMGMTADLLTEDLEIVVAKQVYHCSKSVLGYDRSDKNCFFIKYEDLLLDHLEREKLLKFCGLEAADDFQDKLAEFEQEIDTENMYKWQKILIKSSEANKILRKTGLLLNYENI